MIKTKTKLAQIVIIVLLALIMMTGGIIFLSNEISNENTNKVQAEEVLGTKTKYLYYVNQTIATPYCRDVKITLNRKSEDKYYLKVTWTSVKSEPGSGILSANCQIKIYDVIGEESNLIGSSDADHWRQDPTAHTFFTSDFSHSDQLPFKFYVENYNYNTSNWRKYEAYVEFNPYDVTVAFNSNGGNTPSPASKKILYGSQYGELPTPTRTGYAFAGWKEDYLINQNKSITNSTTYGFYQSQLTNDLESNTTYGFYAKVKVASAQSIHLYLDGGWVGMRSIKGNGSWQIFSGTFTTGDVSTYTHGGKKDVTLYNIPSSGNSANPASLDGFVMYKINSPSITKETVSKPYNHSLVAHWTANTYKVTYTANGGAGSNYTVNIKYGDNFYCLGHNDSHLNYSRTGYTFSHWIGDNGSNWNGWIGKAWKWEYTHDLVLKAQWTAKNYTVTFNSNGGSTPSPTSKVVTFDSPYDTLPSPTRTGYTFADWWTQASGGSQVTASTKVTTASNHTLYAHWTANNYSFKINPAGGTYNSSTGITTINQNYNTTYNFATSTRTGYTFSGWSIGKNLLNSPKTFNGTSDFVALGRAYMFTNSINVSVSASMNNWAEYRSGDMRLVSCTEGGGWNFEPKGEYIQFACYDSGVGYKCAISSKKLSDLSSGRHTFTGTFDGKYARIYIDGVLSGTSAYYTSGKIGYNASNGIFIGAEAVGNATNPSGGYFKGTIDYVTIVNDATVTKPSSYSIPAYNSVATAQWVENNYTVTFNSNGGSTPSPTSKVVTFDSPYDTLPSPTRTGYTFAGWWTQASGGSQVTASTKVTTASNHTLYAHWTANKIKITLDKNGGHGGTNEFYYTYGINKFYSDANLTQELTSITFPTRAGYTFSHYYGDGSSGGNANEQYSMTTSGVTSTDLHIDIYKDATLKAQWNINSYKLTAKANSGSIPATTGTGWTGSGAEATKMYVYDTAYGTLPVPTKTGYGFAGWWTQASGGTQVSATTKMGAADATIYAHWTISSYTLTADCYGGSAPSTLPGGWTANGQKPYRTLNYQSEYGTLPEPTRQGYIFAGWWTQASGGSEVNSSTKMGAANATIYARWVESWVKYMSDDNPVLDQADGYYKIDSAEKFARLAYLVNYNVDNGKWASYKYKQIADIDLSAHYWQPIGTESYPFSGTFDGTTFDIHNMKTYCGANDYEAYNGVGMFGYNSGATIKNVNNYYVNIKGRQRTGAIAGRDNLSTIQNCRVTGSVTGTAGYIGGLVGLSYKEKVIGCENKATVKGDFDVGGIVGNANETAITNCVNLGTIQGRNATGGIAGYKHYDSVVNCINRGNVTGSDQYIGGIVGEYRSGILQNCINEGTIQGKTNVGGIVGYILGDTDSQATKIENCLNTGMLKATAANSIVGGIVGQATYATTITSSFVDCSITPVNTSKVGGIVGNATVAITITYCGAKVNVTAAASTVQPFYSADSGVTVTCNDSYSLVNNKGTQVNRITATNSGMDDKFGMIPTIHDGLPVPLGIYHTSQYGTTTGIASTLKGSQYGCTTA